MIPKSAGLGNSCETRAEAGANRYRITFSKEKSCQEAEKKHINM